MTMPVQLLLLEDSDADAELVLAYLGRQGFQLAVERCQSLEAFTRLLNTRAWDLVISDFHLSGFDGMAALQVLRDRDPDLPFILISGILTEASAVEAMRKGANDFVLKSNLARLGPIVDRELRDRARRRMSRRDQDELRLLQLAVRQMPDSLVITDPKGVILYANPSLEAVSGYTREELQGQNVRLFSSGQHDAAFYQGLWATLLRGEIWRGTFVNRRKDGGHWENQAVIAPVVGTDGQPTCFISTARDVTHERDLQHRLEQSQRLEAIGVLTGGIAHDFNNILMPIMGNAELGAAHTRDQPAVLHFFDVILRSAQRAADLIRQILTFSRKAESAPQLVDFPSLLKESMKLMRATLPTSLDFRCELEGVQGQVRADPTQLHQIVMNLCTNAAQAMRGLSGQLGISLSRRAGSQGIPCVMGAELPPGDYLCLVVKDTGCGIPTAALDKIFLPFYTTKGPGEGTGLGLSIVHGIVQGMGGGLQVHSEVGAGTEFRVFLPAATGPEQLQGPIGEALPPIQARLMLVDDEAPILEVLDEGLTALGFQVTRFVDPQEALRALTAAPAAFDLLITDQTMPHLSGLSLAQKVTGLRPGFPILLMTGSPSQFDLETVAPFGIREILLKPAPPSQVAQAIHRVLRSGLGAPQSDRPPPTPSAATRPAHPRESQP